LIIFKASRKRKATTQTVDGLTEGEIRPVPPPPAPTAPAYEGLDNTDDSTNTKFCLHPDDPENFLKLSAALRIIVRHQISDQDINDVDRLLREYASGLIRVSKNHTFGGFLMCYDLPAVWIKFYQT
jgi:hypothetical protein